jgi:hypothetical protein
MVYYCAFCSKSADVEDGQDNAIALTLCKRCKESLGASRVTVFWDTTEVLMKLLNRSPLDHVEEEEEEPRS